MRFEFLPAFKGDCFLIHAGTDSAPVLILVDGGPTGTYEQHLRPRLMELRDERGLAPDEPLVIDLVIVSHVDDDHINGIIDLLREIRDAVMAGEPPLFEVRGMWHNSFDEIIGNKEVPLGTNQFGAASFAPLVGETETQREFDAGLLLQSVAQGQELRDLALSDELQIPLNETFDRLILTETGSLTTREVGGITFTIIGPRSQELEELREKHDDWLEEQKAKGKPITPGSLLQALGRDESPANLSSIVLLAERDGRTALLTGDARSDFILKGMKEIGLIPDGGEFEVDLLKMPHHGSDRNVDEEFLSNVTGPDYLFTGNGEHGNPERKTFEMLLKARPNATMKFALTYPVAEIDAERKVVHTHERNKELARKAKGKLRGEPRSEWSDAKHSLSALFATLPARITVVDGGGALGRVNLTFGPHTTGGDWDEDSGEDFGSMPEAGSHGSGGGQED